MPSASIIGLGLIGGSIARRLIERGWSVRWNDSGVDRAVVTAEIAELKPAEWPELLAADLIILATPTGIAIEMVRNAELSGSVITTVCSVMHPLVDAAASRSVRLVAGHPMAGREIRGWEGSSAGLFEDRSWFVDEDASDRDPHGLVRRMIEDCGALAIPINPVEHDHYAALASHLPQLLSSALAAVIDEENVPEPFRGPGLQTFLRLAGSSWSMWEPVFEVNADFVEEARKKLDGALRKVSEGHGQEVFDRANDLWRSLNRDR